MTRSLTDDKAWPAVAGARRPFARRSRRWLNRMFERLEAVPLGTGTAGAVTFLGLTVAYGVIVGGHWSDVVDMATANSGFAIESVKMSGQYETSDSALLAALGIDPGVSLVAFDVSDARQRVMALPWVDKASIQKLYPDTLSVVVTERTPFALWYVNGAYSLIDRTGRVIAEGVDPTPYKLPVVAGAGAPEGAATILSALKSMPGIGGRTRAVVRIGERRWDVVLKDGITIELPEEQPEAALADLVKIDAESGLLSRNIAVVDLRLPDRIVVRMPHDVAEQRRELLSKKPKHAKEANT